MNAQQLKNAILQEAIEGRLVPQDPNDEPASALLARIRKEKEQLVKAGKLKKKDLEVKPISEDEIPFEIPESWEWVRLGRITDVKGGKRIPVGYKWQDTPTSHIYIRVSDMKDGTISSSDLKYINDEIYNQIKQYTINKEDLYLTIVGSTIGKAGFVPSVFDGMNLTENAVKLSSISIYKEYLYYLIISPFAQSQFVDKTKQVGQPKLAINRILSSLLPIPPIAEQHRIVAKIEELLPKVEKYGKAQDALNKLNAELPERLKKSILQEAIEGRLVPQDPNDEPASVLLVQIRKEKERLMKEGKLKKKDLIETPITEDEIPFDIPESWEKVKLSFVTSLTEGEKKEGNYVCLDAKYLRGKSTGELLSKGKFVYKNDNIILVDGENSGEVFTVPCDGFMGSTFKQLWVSKAMCLKYVLYFIMAYKDILRNSKKGAAIPHLNKDIFNNLVIGIPPLAEQHRIVEKLEQLLGEIDKLKK